MDKHQLYNAINFDSYASSADTSIKELTDYIFEDLSKDIKITSRQRQRDALKHVIVNAIISYRLNRPIKYSRRKSDYSSNGFYGQDWFRYDRIIPIIDWMIEHEYLEHAKGMFDKESKSGFQSKFWAGEKLLKLFIDFKLTHGLEIEREWRPKPIILKDRIKRQKNGRKIPKRLRTKPKTIDYNTTAATRRMSDFLCEYNNFIQGANITLELDSDSEITIDFLIKAVSNEVHGYATITEVEFKECGVELLAEQTNSPNIDNLTLLYTTLTLPNHILSNLYQPYPTTYTTYPHTYPTPYLPTDTGTFRRKHTTGVGSQRLGIYAKTYLIESVLEVENIINHTTDKDEKSRLLKSKMLLDSIGLVKLHMRLDYNYLHRVFNERSFQKGGRFYGATHIGYKSNIRKKIKINGESVVEPDYSGLHIRMLYNQVGIDYQGECYVHRKNDLEHKEDREKFKIVALVSINAESYEAANAIYSEFKKHQMKMNSSRKNEILGMIDEFKKFHEPIMRFLFSGIGLDLQYKDSMIMEAVLKRMMAEGIVALPVHDSVIVQAKHEELLKQVMMEEYKKVMGFLPVL